MSSENQALAATAREGLTILGYDQNRANGNPMKPTTFEMLGTGPGLALLQVMTNTMLRQTQTVPALTSLDDEWTERTVVLPGSRRRVLRAIRARETAFTVADKFFPTIARMLPVDLYGETKAVLDAVAKEVAA
jgi:hypothetical protein